MSQQLSSSEQRAPSNRGSSGVESLIDGVLDPFSGDVVAGWVWDPSDENARFSVEIIVDGEVVATVLADRPRPKLAQRGIGDGRYGFKVTLGHRLEESRAHVVRARVAGFEADLRKSPRTFGANRAPTSADDAPPISPRKAVVKPFLSSAAVRSLFTAMTDSEPLARAEVSDAVKAVIEQSPLDDVRSLPDAERADIVRRMSERAEFEDPSVCLIVEVDGAPLEAIEATLASWALQGVRTPPVLLADPNEHERVGSDLETFVTSRQDWTPPAQGFLLFAKAGDTFHPSLASLVRSAPRSTCGVAWDLAIENTSTAGSIEVLRRPISFGQASVAGCLGPVGFAVRAELLDWASRVSKSPAIVAQVLVGATPGARWFYLPETLSSTRSDETAENVLSRWSRARSESGFAELLRSAAPQFQLLALTHTTLVAPCRSTAAIGVVLIGDSGEHLRTTLASLARQEPIGGLDLTIVRSAKGESSEPDIGDAAGALLPGARIQITDCLDNLSDASRNNFGASHLSAPVLVFLTAGIDFEHSNSLEALACWAVADGVGVVTCRTVVDGIPLAPDREQGMGVRRGRPDDRSLCFAVSREAWRMLGEFDDRAFSSLFDVEWRLRADSLGYEHLHLTDVTVLGQERAIQGRSSERLLLRALYPQKGYGACGPGTDPLVLAERSDERAAFLAARLLSDRRAMRRSRQDAADELAQLNTLVADLRRAVESLSLKLDRG